MEDRVPATKLVQTPMDHSTAVVNLDTIKVDITVLVSIVMMIIVCFGFFDNGLLKC